MNFDSLAGTVVIGGASVAVIGLGVLAIAGTRAAPLLGMRTGAPWWFSPAGGRTQGAVVAYLGLVVALAALVGLAVSTALPDAGSLAWTATWVSAALVVAATVTHVGRLVVHLATDGRGTTEEPVEADFVDADAALDDIDLRAARRAALSGDWQPAAQLLTVTRDPDVRWSRIEVLAEAADRRRSWVDQWLDQRPGDRDALAVRAQAGLVHACEIRGQDWTPREVGRFRDALEDAEAYALEAAATYPGDPAPRVTLVALARFQEVPRDELDRRLRSVLDLAPGHRGAHEQALQYLAPKWHGSADEVLRFARTASAAAPAGSDLALLPVVAHIEQYVMLMERTAAIADRHITSAAVREEIRAAAARWTDGADGTPRVAAASGHNVVAFAAWLAELPELAAEHLAFTREHLDPFPWCYGGDPTQVHAAAQAWARQRAPQVARA
jgi:hypothetical protein